MNKGEGGSTRVEEGEVKENKTKKKKQAEARERKAPGCGRQSIAGRHKQAAGAALFAPGPEAEKASGTKRGEEEGRAREAGSTREAPEEKEERLGKRGTTPRVRGPGAARPRPGRSHTQRRAPGRKAQSPSLLRKEGPGRGGERGGGEGGERGEARREREARGEMALLRLCQR